MPRATINLQLSRLSVQRLSADPGARPATLAELSRASNVPPETLTRIQRSGSAKSETLFKIVAGLRKMGLADVSVGDLLIEDGVAA